MRHRPRQLDRRAGGSLRWATILVVFVLALAACGGNGESQGVDEPAPDAGPETVSLPDESFQMSDGTTTTLSDFTGQPLVVNFFASWCPPCRAEMPDFQQVHDATAGEVRFLGFALQDTEAAAAALIEETGVSYEWALDPEGAVYAGFQGFSMPTTVYVSADGEVLERDNGSIDASTLEKRLEQLFDVTVR